MTKVVRQHGEGRDIVYWKTRTDAARGHARSRISSRRLSAEVSPYGLGKWWRVGSESVTICHEQKGASHVPIIPRG